MAAAMSMCTATHLIVRGLLLRPLRLSTAASTPPFSLFRHHPNLSFRCPHFRPFSLPLHASIPSAQSEPQSGLQSEEREDELDAKSGGVEKLDDNENESKSNSPVIPGLASVVREVPNLTIKEKKELGSYANSLGDKLKSQQIGKSGVTDNVVFALSETLEANELIKLKIHRSCPGELEDVVGHLERAMGCVAVFQIGRTVIFYRPSITKMKEEEKKEQNRRLFAQKRKKAQAAFMMKRKEQLRHSARSQNGGRRFENAPS